MAGGGVIESLFVTGRRGCEPELTRSRQPSARYRSPVLRWFDGRLTRHTPVVGKEFVDHP